MTKVMLKESREILLNFKIRSEKINGEKGIEQIFGEVIQPTECAMLKVNLVEYLVFCRIKFFV